MTDFEADLCRIEQDLRGTVAESAGGLSETAQSRPWRLYREFQHISITGELSRLGGLAAAIESAMGSSSHAADLCLLKAHVAMKRHRFNEAEEALRGDASLATFPLTRLLQADLHLQQGRYADAQSGVDEVLAEEPTWDAFARAAYLASLRNETAKADSLYEQAEDELTVKQMQTYAWLELQRGWCHLQRGDHGQAQTHYRRADRAYSGYWLVAERMAELAGVEGRFQEALHAYERLYAGSERPEWAHALGDLQAVSGDVACGARWKRKAYEGYVASLQRGEIYYLHSLVELCCETAARETEAIEYARADVSARSNFMTQGDMAWALYRGGRMDEAAPWMERALASGMVSARLYLQAACLYASTGDAELSRKYMQLARKTNPKPGRAYLRAGRGLGSPV